jgi:antitoxin component YwqK of YwqJK toxin-antitoxin module
MRNLLLFVVLLFTASCNDESNDKPKEVKDEVLIEVKNGIYREWYPGKKQVKYKGGQDVNKKRHGVWTFCSEGGNELSVTYYEHGLREGFSIVKYPNGALHYRGEYHNDQTVGIWSTYNEKGEFVSETDFGYLEK